MEWGWGGETWDNIFSIRTLQRLINLNYSFSKFEMKSKDNSSEYTAKATRDDFAEPTHKTIIISLLEENFLRGKRLFARSLYKNPCTTSTRYPQSAVLHLYAITWQFHNFTQAQRTKLYTFHGNTNKHHTKDYTSILPKVMEVIHKVCKI